MSKRGRYIVRRRPSSYAINSQQEKFKRVARECGIVKGITRDELVDKMVNCVPEAWRKIKEESQLTPP